MTRHQPAQSKQVGAFKVTAIQDGQMLGNVNIMPSFDDDKARAYCDRIGAEFTHDRHTSVNCFILETGGRTIVVDTGSPPDFHKDAGWYPEAFAGAGYKPEDIDVVVITHLHIDHWGNLLRREDGQAFFPRAELVVCRTDYDYVMDDDVMSMLDGVVREKQQRARDCCAPYQGRTRTIPDDGEILPGLHYVTMPGHSPGHSGVLIDSEGEQLFIFADMAHSWFWQAPFPEWFVQYDRDPHMGIVSRKRTLQRIVDEGWPCAGMHTPFPGWCHVERDGDAFRIFPDI